MRSTSGRSVALAAAVLVFFLAWAAVAARPWVRPRADARVAQLALREQRLRREAVLVQRLVRERWAVYRLRLAARKRAIAAAAAPAPVPASAPAVRVVTLPPLTITRTS